jgi:hypothetical protein
MCIALKREPIAVRDCSPHCKHSGDIDVGLCSGFRPCCIAFFVSVYKPLGPRFMAWWQRVVRRAERYATFCGVFGLIGKLEAAKR